MADLRDEWIPPEHREVHDYLISWGRWLWTHYPQGHCRSIEHRFRLKPRGDDTPNGWGDWLTTPPPQTPIPIEEGKALIVECQMRWLPELHRDLLALKYYRRGTSQWIARKLRIKPHEFGDKLYAARQNVLNLTRADLWPTVRGRFHNLRLPTSVESAAR